MITPRVRFLLDDEIDESDVSMDFTPMGLARRCTGEQPP
jgi:hypothetical protein